MIHASTFSGKSRHLAESLAGVKSKLVVPQRLPCRRRNDGLGLASDIHDDDVDPKWEHSGSISSSRSDIPTSMMASAPRTFVINNDFGQFALVPRGNCRFPCAIAVRPVAGFSDTTSHAASNDAARPKIPLRSPSVVSRPRAFGVSAKPISSGTGFQYLLG